MCAAVGTASCHNGLDTCAVCGCGSPGTVLKNHRAVLNCLHEFKC